MAVTVEKVAEKNFNFFKYNETTDHKRTCENCETLLDLGKFLLIIVFHTLDTKHETCNVMRKNSKLKSCFILWIISEVSLILL